MPPHWSLEDVPFTVWDLKALFASVAETTYRGEAHVEPATEAPDHFDRVLAAGALSVSRAIVRGVTMATGLGGIPSVGELATT